MNERYSLYANVQKNMQVLIEALLAFLFLRLVDILLPDNINLWH